MSVVGFVEQIREEVRKSGLSQYRLAAKAGVQQAALSRFVNGGGLSMASLDAVAAVLELEVVKGKRDGA